MKNKKIQLALLVLMTSGFSAVYAPEMGEPLEEGGGSGEGEGGGGAGEGGEGGTIAEREGGQDGNNGGKPNGPVETTGGGDTEVFTQEQLALQQKALTALAKQISTVADSSSSLEISTRSIRGNSLNTAFKKLSTSVQSIKNALNDETLNKQSSTVLLDTLSKQIKSLEGQRNTLQRAGDNVDDINECIKNANMLFTQVRTYAETFGDSGNHNLADNALTSLGSLLGKKTLSPQDIQDLGSTLKQLVDNASLDYLQANRSSIETALEKMQGIAKLPSDVTNNMTLLDASMKLIDANNIIVTNKMFLDSAFVRAIGSFFDKIFDFFKSGDSQQAKTSRHDLQIQMQSQIENIAGQDSKTLDILSSKQNLSNADIGRIKTIIRKASAITDMINSANEAIDGISSGELLNSRSVTTLLTKVIEQYPDIVWDMVLADAKETPLAKVINNSTLTTALAKSLGEAPSVDFLTVKNPGAAQKLADAAIIAKRMQYLIENTKIFWNKEPVSALRESSLDSVVRSMRLLYNKDKIAALRFNIRQLPVTSALAKISMNSSLDTISQVLKAIGINE